MLFYGLGSTVKLPTNTMDITAEIIRERQLKALYGEVKQLARDQFSVDKLDPGRQQDVFDCLFAIRTSKRPEEVMAAKKALRTIYKEYENRTLRDARRWIMNEKKQGRHENVKNFYEDVERDKKKWNPYG